METNELPALTGTEKQIAWANDIRARFIAGLDAADAYVVTHTEIRNAEPVIDGLAYIREFIASVQNARWFIDYRDHSLGRAIVASVGPSTPAFWPIRGELQRASHIVEMAARN